MNDDSESDKTIKLPADPHDKLFRAVWSRPDQARSFIQENIPKEVVACFALHELKLSKDTFVDPKLKAHYSDLVYETRLVNGEPAVVFLLFEHKSHPDPWTPYQVIKYICRIWEQWENSGKLKKYLPAVLPIVIYHGETGWTCGNSLNSRYNVPDVLLPYLPNFRYVLCDLTALSDEQIRGEILLKSAMMLMKHIRDPELLQHVPGILSLIWDLLDRKTALDYIEVLLRYVQAGAKDLTEAQFKKAVNDALKEEGNVVMGTLAEKWIEEGFEKGIKKGIKKGIEKGIEKGEISGQAKFLMRQLIEKYGAKASDYESKVQKASPEELEKWGSRVLTTNRLEEIFL